MRTLAAAAAAALAVAAQAREVGGANLPEAVVAGGRTLQLNGAGIRKRFFLKVYAGGLYLESRSSDPQAVVAADQAKVVRMHLLRDVDAASILGAFRDGFEKNSKATAAAASAHIPEIAKVLPEKVKEGQVLVVSYVPGAGSTVGVEGGPAAAVAGKEFADALFRNWLGPAPADEDLKQGMLGR
jgi:hypothetical protein